MNHRTDDFCPELDPCPGFSPRELHAISSRETSQKLKAWLEKREPMQISFRQVINGDVKVLEGRRKG